MTDVVYSLQAVSCPYFLNLACLFYSFLPGGGGGGGGEGLFFVLSRKGGN